MKRLRTLLVVKIALAIVLGTAVYVTAMPSADAIVIAGPSICSYFKDATFKKVVGGRGTGCCGEVFNWGIITPYVRCERLYCLDVLCPF